MQLETAVRVLGLSQLAQIPATVMLAADGVLGLRSELAKLSPINAAIVRVLGAAAVILLVAAGVLVALYPDDALYTGLGRALTGFLGAFWTARLCVQLYYGRLWPTRVRRWHYFMCLVFCVQGPGYLLVRWSSSF